VFARDHLRLFDAPLWRVFRTEGPHALEWNELRHFGPVPGMRFDPHPAAVGAAAVRDPDPAMPAAAMHPDCGVMYAAAQPVTALAEVYQRTRVIDRGMGGATIVAWQPARALRLLDLTGDWPVLNGAAAALMMAVTPATQVWARAIVERLGDEIDGLYHQSSIDNRPVVTLFSRVERVPAFPPRLSFRARLDDALADEVVLQAAMRLGYGVG
jgi:hypothetical protein